MKIHPHPTIIKKMRTFLDVENKMGPMIPMPTPNGQIRPPVPETNLNFCKNDNIEKRKTVMPKRKFRPATPRIAVMCPPLPQTPQKT